ncbi:hypothetical protein D6D17_09281 [Aureobasidium pullulans]|nr:hypothetical protein D6D17_09281 [Aureobasidium pullulans]
MASLSISKSSVFRQRSDPVDPVTTNLVVKTIKRGLTDGPRRTVSNKDPVIYAEQLFNQMKANLKSLNLNTSRMIQSNFEFLLPGRSSTKYQLTIFEALRATPITVTNAELGRIFDLELSTETSPATEDNFHHFYIRSWTFTYSELAALCSHMSADGARLPEVSNWLDVAKLYRQKTDVFTIRYAGTVLGPGRPYDRYVEDLGVRTSGILAEFTRAVDTVVPHIGQAAQIFLVRNASVAEHDVLMTMSDPEDRERMLIELLGHQSLLNRQRGGYFTSYVPFYEDVELFKDLRTDAWGSYKNNRLNCPDETLANLTALFDDIQSYANENADLTGTWKYEFSDNLRDMSLGQATPHCFQNVTPVVFIGKDISESAYINATPYLNPRSIGQAGQFLRDVIHRLVDDETVANGRDVVPNSFRMDRSFWVFYDLWQWLAHKDLEAAARFLQRYLATVRPLIAVAFGLVTNNVTRANFDSLNGIKMNSYTSVVCEPSIQYYDNAKKHDANSAFINVPLYDPGRDKYGSNSPEIRRLIDLSMRYVFLLVDTAGAVLSEQNSNMPLNRLDMCKAIIARMERLSETDPIHRAFMAALKSARDNCAAYIRINFSQTASEDVRPVLDHAGRQIIQSLGVAKGDPQSTERHKQLDSIWELNLPELHTIIGHEDSLKNDWKAIFLPLHQDQYFYLAVLAQLPPDRYLVELLDTVRPTWATNDSWVHKKEVRDSAIAKVQGGLWISRRKDEDRKYTVQFPDAAVSAKNLHGHQVGFVESNGKARIRWIRSDGITETTILDVVSAISKSDFETRTLLFTEHGINVVSGTGDEFRTRFDQQSQATIPLDQLLHNPKLYPLWSAVRLAHGHNVPPFGTQFDESLAKHWGKKQGVAALVHSATSEKPPQNRPPEENDALYPLDQYLKIYFPQGGTFYYHTPDKEVVKDKRRLNAKSKAIVTTENMKQFLEMLDTPEWAKHPYRDFWKGELQGKKIANVALFSKNLPILRHTTLKTFGGGSRPIFWELGAPGSALDEPFDQDYGQSCLSGASGRGVAGKTFKAAKAGKQPKSDGATEPADHGTTNKAKGKESTPKAGLKGTATSTTQSKTTTRAPYTALSHPGQYQTSSKRKTEDDARASPKQPPASSLAQSPPTQPTTSSYADSVYQPPSDFPADFFFSGHATPATPAAPAVPAASAPTAPRQPSKRKAEQTPEDAEGGKSAPKKSKLKRR